jgi:hypothetical protein
MNPQDWNYHRDTARQSRKLSEIGFQRSAARSMIGQLNQAEQESLRGAKKRGIRSTEAQRGEAASFQQSTFSGQLQINELQRKAV